MRRAEVLLGFSEGKMRKALGCVSVLLAMGWAGLVQAEGPKCEAQRTGMEQARARAEAAWAEWNKALTAVAEAQADEQIAWEALLAAQAKAGAAERALKSAREATDSCHRQNGYTSRCAGAEHAEAAATDAYRQAVAGTRQAHKKWTDAENKTFTAERRESSTYQAADRLEQSYHQYIESYNDCLRSKPRSA